jgi:hypothetical protein
MNGMKRYRVIAIEREEETYTVCCWHARKQIRTKQILGLLARVGGKPCGLPGS